MVSIEQHELFNKDDSRFAEIWKVISNYYPVGLSSEDDNYKEHPNHKKYLEVVFDNIHNRDNFESRWKKFSRLVERETRKNVIGSTFGYDPGFSDFIVLESHQYETCHHIKKLHYAVSLLGDFYTVFGVDEVEVLYGEYDSSYSYNSITSSPFKEYEDLFTTVQSTINKKYPNHKFIPFYIAKSFISDVEVSYISSNYSTVYVCLFNNLLPAPNTKYIRGDRWYGMEDWDTENGRGWSGYPPN